MSEAHITAVAAMAGVNLAVSRRDYGVDGHFREVQKLEDGSYSDAGISLDFQAKATVVFKIENEQVVYDLDAGAYNKMVSRGHHRTTLILILLCLPQSPSEWHLITPDGTLLKDRCYWHVLPPGPLTPNKSSVRIRIPIHQRFTPEALEGLLLLEQARPARSAA
jgi:hypothetical protein